MSQNLRVLIYTDHPSKALETEVVSEYLQRFGISTVIRGDFLQFLSLRSDAIFRLAETLASTRIDDIEKPIDGKEIANKNDVVSEVNKLTDKESYHGVFYDGLWIQRMFHKLIADDMPDETGDGFLHMIFTGRMFGTFEKKRYHARVVLAGEPSMISTSGLVEAPAKPREYYFIKGGLIQSGRDTAELDAMYKGRFVEYDDPKITSILCSYALQAVSYKLTGTAFCEDSSCCLYNSHWQEEVLKVQYQAKPCELCLENIKECLEG